MDIPEWVDPALYPFRPHELRVEAGCLRYLDEGAGEPLVLVHGNPTWSFLYRDLIRHFAGRYRCVAPDHLGFGLSDKPKGWEHHPAQHTANLDALLTSLDLRGLTLVVHDWGGPIGLRWAVDHADRVRRLVILNSWGWSVRGEPRYQAFSRLAGGAAGRWLNQRFNLIARVGMKRIYAEPDRLTPRIHRHYLEPLATPSDRRGSGLLPRAVVGASDWLGALERRLGVLRDVPAAIVWGMADPAFRPSELERWSRLFPHAEVTRLDGVGHYVPEEGAGELIDAVERLLSRS